jgi:hypothetical protein
MKWIRPVAVVIWLAIFAASPQWTTAVTLIAAGTVFILFNAVIFVQTVVRDRDAPSVALAVGGVFAAAGIALLPFPGIWKWAWVPLLIDWGGLPLLFFALFRRPFR